MPSILDPTLSSANECWACPGVLAMPSRKCSGSQRSGAGHDVRHHLGLVLSAGWQYAGSFVQGQTKPCGDHDLGAMWECPFLASLGTGTPADTSQAAGEARRAERVLVQWPCQRMILRAGHTRQCWYCAPCWLQKVQGPQAASCPLTRPAQLHCMLQSPHPACCYGTNIPSLLLSYCHCGCLTPTGSEGRPAASGLPLLTAMHCPLRTMSGHCVQGLEAGQQLQAACRCCACHPTPTT